MVARGAVGRRGVTCFKGDGVSVQEDEKSYGDGRRCGLHNSVDGQTSLKDPQHPRMSTSPPPSDNSGQTRELP